jgi:hypothetical protein
MALFTSLCPLSRAALSALLFASAIVPSLFAQTAVAPRVPAKPVEWRSELSFAGRADLTEGTIERGDLRHRSFRLDGVKNAPLGPNDSYLIGGSWRRFEFSDSAAPIPESLDAVVLKLGYSRTLSRQWTLLAEIDPGLYSDFKDISGDDFNAPIGLRLAYGFSRELQWLFGMNVDLRSSNPVIGGFGVRWQFAPDWTLAFIIPEPRVEYALSQAVRLTIGASLRSGTFRVAEDFGRRRGRPELDNLNLDFREISAGVGARWEVQPGLTVSAMAGWMIDRRFEFDARRLLFNGDGAPMLRLSVVGGF